MSEHPGTDQPSVGGPGGDRDAGAPRELEDFGFHDDSWESRLAAARQTRHEGNLGEYRIIELVGRGGQGAVYKAVQPGTGRTVALKRFALAGVNDQRAADRFRREVELAASLHHPGIVTVFGLTESDSAVVMEWIDGVSADAWADRVRETPDATRRIMTAVHHAAAAVAHAHARGVIHRDLKPSNVLIDTNDRPRLVDFGLARAIESDPGSTPRSHTLTIEGAFAGTPAYAPPEQIDHGLHEADVRADVYALGAVLYRLLTGRDAFQSPTLAGLFDAIRRGFPAAPSVHRPGIDAELDAIVLMALRPRREERYQTMQEFADDLARWLDRKTVHAMPTTTSYLARAFVRRHRVGVGLGVLALLLIVGSAIAAGLTALSLDRERTALKRTITERDAAANEATRQRTKVQQDFMKSLAVNIGLMNVIQAVADGNSAYREALLNAFIARAESLDRSKIPMKPEIAVANRLNLAQVFEALGDTARQRAQLERAIEIARARAPNSSDLSEALGQAASLALAEARYADAAALYEESLDVIRAVLRDRDQDFGYAEVSYAEALAGAGRKDDAQRQIDSLRNPASTGAVRAEAMSIVAEACRKWDLRTPSWVNTPSPIKAK